MKTLATLAGLLAMTTAPAWAQTELDLWYHGAGNPVERDILVGIIDDFNASQSDWVVKLEQFPQAAYNDSVTAAALAGNLPDILDVDGPIMPNWAWSGYLQPLTLTEDEIADFLPGTIGRWQDKLYSIGLWDAAIAMYARKSVLDENGIRIPTLDQPWNKDEFDNALSTLKDTGKFDYPLDLGMAWTGEWYAYAFSPLLESFGGDLVDRATYQTADGTLNGDAGLAFGDWWQGLFTNELAPGTSQDGAARETGFIDGKYALQWNGNWAALPAIEAFGDDMLFLPAPDFGNGPKIGAASWQFGVAATSEHPEGANAFIAFAIQDKYLAAFSDGLGLIPATSTAAALTTNYKPGGPMEMFFELSNKQGELRPVSPGYVVMSPLFEKALSDIANGGDPADALDTAADAITADIARNKGYGQQ